MSMRKTTPSPSNSEGVSTVPSDRNMSRPRVDPALAWSLIDGDVVALRGTGTAHQLSGTGALLWQLFDGAVSVGQIAEDVTAVFGASPDTALSDVVRFVDEMTGLGLLIDDGELSPRQPAIGTPAVSRDPVAHRPGN